MQLKIQLISFVSRASHCIEPEQFPFIDCRCRTKEQYEILKLNPTMQRSIAIHIEHCVCWCLSIRCANSFDGWRRKFVVRIHCMLSDKFVRFGTSIWVRLPLPRQYGAIEIAQIKIPAKSKANRNNLKAIALIYGIEKLAWKNRSPGA